MQEMNGDVVFTCPRMPYEFDEARYKIEGTGGSETALFEIARLLKEKTKRSVKVFKAGPPCIGESGVEYFDIDARGAYFSKNRPQAHISWRHNERLTYAKTYLWAHNVTVDGIEWERNFDFAMCLSNFHKKFMHRNQMVPYRKIILTRNGVNPDKLSFAKPRKNENKIVWMSSPDRGLKWALAVMDELVRRFPNLEMHVYYGFHLLYLYGLGQEADELKRMIAQRPYVKYHGFVEQSKMYREMGDAVVWLYPCGSLETFCITALEMLALGVFPVARRHGALAETLGEAERNGGATLLDHLPTMESGILAYADAVSTALKGRLWEKTGLDLAKHSWSSVADEWIAFMNLS